LNPVSTSLNQDWEILIVARHTVIPTEHFFSISDKALTKSVATDVDNSLLTMIADDNNVWRA
jgi:hypothetical protein